MRYLILMLSFIALKGWGGENFARDAQEVILMDAETGAVLFEKNADQLTHPSSMTKIMSVYLAFERLKDGRMTLHDQLPVSVKAWKTGGTRMFLEPNTHVPLGEILQGVIVVSGNDASVALAEGLGGTEENFAQEMTTKAHALGAVHTTFKNAHGLSRPNHTTTARDLAIIARHLIKNFPEYYPMFSQKRFTYNKIAQSNRNPLLSFSHMNADGIKTGHTDEGGYGLVGSATKGDMRLILVVNGAKSEKKRALVSERLLSWGLREFKRVTLARPGEVLEMANTWLGEENTVGLTVSEDINLILEQAKVASVKAEVVYKGPIEAPIKKGQVLGKLLISIPGKPAIERALVAMKDVQKVGPFKRVLSALSHIIWGQS